MSTSPLVPSGQAVYDTDLLQTLRGRNLSRQLKTLCVIGAHRFDELALINRVFPSLERIYLFEPQAEPLAALDRLAALDSRIKVFAVAVSDTDGTATFNVASNNGESSSLLQLGSHRELFPEVTMDTSIQVPTRRLESVLEEHALPHPDVMIIDVQGAEYLVLKSFSTALRSRVRLIYTEVSTERVYASSGLLSEVETLLAPEFVNLGFAPIRASVPMHGNAIFVARSDVPAALAMTLHGRLRTSFHRLKRHLRGSRKASVQTST